MGLRDLLGAIFGYIRHVGFLHIWCFFFSNYINVLIPKETPFKGSNYTSQFLSYFSGGAACALHGQPIDVDRLHVIPHSPMGALQENQTLAAIQVPADCWESLQWDILQLAYLLL